MECGQRAFGPPSQGSIVVGGAYVSEIRQGFPDFFIGPINVEYVNIWDLNHNPCLVILALSDPDIL